MMAEIALVILLPKPPPVYSLTTTTLVMSGCGEPLRADLTERGYRVITLPLDAFRASGGAAFCLTLRLDRRSGATSLPRRRYAVA